jgi:ATP-binding cassette subfamily B protein
MLLVALSKVTQVYVIAFSLKWAVDAMAGGRPVGDVVGGGAGDRLRRRAVRDDAVRQLCGNTCSSASGQEATRRLAATGVRAPAPAVLRFHLEGAAPAR